MSGLKKKVGSHEIIDAKNINICRYFHFIMILIPDVNKAIVRCEMGSKIPAQPTCDTSETLLWTGEGGDTSHSLRLLKRDDREIFRLVLHFKFPFSVIAIDPLPGD